MLVENLPETDLAVLQEIRHLKLTTRASPRIDVFEACQAITLHNLGAGINGLDLLIQTLPQVIDRNLKVNQPHDTFLSWDERWLVSLVRSVCANDFDSVQFLIRVLIPKMYQSEIKTITSELLRLSA
tara:strand:+ start:181 stop:561 length:381 start_codon:yes stop_codon:yes gene_type:complete